ncbi:tellurium resistance protein TerW [Xenorhabdus hominickii]|uniref:Tellurium resistance protein TerW n=1 Tax=Xenorhabdus hominickii TaxID=351679 RepID=A0A2G0Q7Z3_XENHO|nr:tellurium resistance protein TerW [Xenorhabdus hominickii]AOM41390.1 tellurium resistance protein TerW [Xenorhabdus hominickii]PHM55335.1 tellurium resistance protein TerW [Xenorhabdus hominickii]PHM57300.1 tellurium resistance protein TerW [Xenorhabdus hominickii]
MLLSPKQFRNFKLTLLLSHGKPVSKVKIIRELHCSEPTLTRALRELRDLYCADIRFSKIGNTYQLIDKGMLTKKDVRRIEELLAQHLSLHAEEVTSHVFLDKEKKKSISLSLRMSVIRKIDGLANRLETTRSEVVEMVVDGFIETLLKETLNSEPTKQRSP